MESCTSAPFGIAIDTLDYVCISEPLLRKVSVFTNAGRFVRCFQVCVEGQDSINEDQNTPHLAGLAFDKRGKLYACMPRKGQVVIL